MQTQNNYDIEWTKLNLDTGKTEHSTGIFNGEMGTIIDIDEYEDLIVIKFEDGKIARYKFTELDQIVHSYAITVHKSQGSEFDYVIMPIINVPRMLLTRNVLYTGMTRARKKLMLISNETTIEYMIGNVNSKKRNSGLKFKLQEIFKD
jgi:exodeoxyribonuclease V alpha subunit